jgi:endonuclease/exonuclease/phosphatase family metal-dependent hydrolase
VAASILALTFLIWAPASSSGEVRDPGKQGIDIATVNLHIGADFGPLLTLDPADPDFPNNLVAGVAAIYGQIRQSNFPARADALARLIVARDSDLVALQEVALIRRQSPGDSIVGGTLPARQIDLDYLAVLLEALRRHGGKYEVASQVEEVDVEVPLITGAATFDDVRLTDRDVILVRSDVPPGHLRTFNAQSANFIASLPLPIGVNVVRGWCAIDVQTRGRQFRFINTHLEDGLPPPLPNVQLAQAVELLSGPAGTSMPVILAGDFNSDAYGNYSPATYALLTGAGTFRDVWSLAGGRSLGLTWGHDSLLSNFAVPFLLRLDLLLIRGGNLEATSAVVDDPIIGTTPPFWFSDHAAVFARVTTK